MSIFQTATPSSLMRGMERFILSGVVPSLQYVSWHEGSNAYTDGSTIHLPIPVFGMSDMDLLLWRYKAQHEIGHESDVNCHPHWKEQMMVEKPKNPDKILWGIANLISDHVQEKNCLGRFKGQDDLLLRGRAAFLLCEVIPAARKERFESLMSQLWLLDCRERNAWNEHMPDVSMYETSAVNDFAKCGAWSAVRNEKDALELAREIRKLFPDPPEAEDESKGKGGSESGDDDGDSEEGDGDGEEGEGKASGTPNKPDDGAKVGDARIFVPVPHDENPGHGVHNNHSYRDDGTLITSGVKQFTVRTPMPLKLK